MSETFVTAATKISEIKRKQNALLEQAANIVADVIVTKCKKDKITDISTNDLDNMLKEFNDSDRSTIYCAAALIIAKNAVKTSPDERPKPKKAKETVPSWMR